MEMVIPAHSETEALRFGSWSIDQSGAHKSWERCEPVGHSDV
jgi:hypothetical protein